MADDLHTQSLTKDCRIKRSLLHAIAITDIMAQEVDDLTNLTILYTAREAE